MNRLHRIALLLTALGTLPAVTTAQTIYRCGDSYSQTPCPGGQAIQAADERSKAQKAQTDAATQRDNRTANAMEKSRLKQEDIQARTTSTPAQSSPHPTAGSGEQGRKSASGKKGKQPAYFTARESGEKKKKSGTHAQASDDGKPVTAP